MPAADGGAEGGRHHGPAAVVAEERLLDRVDGPDGQRRGQLVAGHHEPERSAVQVELRGVAQRVLAARSQKGHSRPAGRSAYVCAAVLLEGE